MRSTLALALIGKTDEEWHMNSTNGRVARVK